MWTPNENSIPPKHLQITILSQTMRAPRPMSRKGGLIATTGSQSGNSGRLRSSRPSIGNLDGKSKFEIRPIHMGENAPDWEGTNADADANMATRANIVFIILGEVIGCWKTREIIGRCIDGGVCVCVLYGHRRVYKVPMYVSRGSACALAANRRIFLQLYSSQSYATFF